MTIEYLLLDSPSDHEVDDSVVTECDVIKAIVSNKDEGQKVKLVKSTTKDRFSRPPVPLKSVTYVHLSGHGNEKGLCLIGGSVKWKDVAKQIAKSVKKLTNDQQRVLCISCCYSKEAAAKMTRNLSDYFTAIYYFREKKVTFAKAMAVWPMFYHEKDLSNPEKPIVKRINKFFDGKVLACKRIPSDRAHRNRK